MHFGLGPATRVDRLEVRWANGPTASYDVPAVDSFLVIVIGGLGSMVGALLGGLIFGVLSFGASFYAPTIAPAITVP